MISLIHFALSEFNSSTTLGFQLFHPLGHEQDQDSELRCRKAEPAAGPDKARRREEEPAGLGHLCIGSRSGLQVGQVHAAHLESGSTLRRTENSACDGGGLKLGYWESFRARENVQGDVALCPRSRDLHMVLQMVSSLQRLAKGDFFLPSCKWPGHNPLLPRQPVPDDPPTLVWNFEHFMTLKVTRGQEFKAQLLGS